MATVGRTVSAHADEGGDAGEAGGARRVGDGTGGPCIIGASIAAGHDGLAEVTIDVQYANGAVRSLCLAEEAVGAALDAAGVHQLTELVGRPWTVLLVDRPRPTDAPTDAPTDRNDTTDPNDTTVTTGRTAPWT